jgi:hypothetical protein
LLWASDTLHPGALNELHTHSAHSEQDQGRDEAAGQRSTDHDSVGDCPTPPMGEKHAPQSRRQMGKNEKDPKPVVRNEANIPGISDQPLRRARGERLARVYLKIRSGKNEDRIHVADHIERKIDPEASWKARNRSIRSRMYL